MPVVIIVAKPTPSAKDRISVISNPVLLGNKTLTLTKDLRVDLGTDLEIELVG